jgi:hypothetical protein
LGIIECGINSGWVNGLLCYHTSPEDILNQIGCSLDHWSGGLSEACGTLDGGDSSHDGNFVLSSLFDELGKDLVLGFDVSMVINKSLEMCLRGFITEWGTFGWLVESNETQYHAGSTYKDKHDQWSSSLALNFWFRGE